MSSKINENNVPDVQIMEVQNNFLTALDPNLCLSLVFHNLNAYVPILIPPSSTNPSTHDISRYKNVFKKVGHGLKKGFHDIFQKPIDDLLKSRQNENNNKKQILYDVYGAVYPGEILALMGPSGSGKTSLLTLLGQRSSPSTEINGTILYGGEKMSKAIKKRIGFVSQDDLLYGELTVYETFFFTAMLRLPQEWAYDTKIQRVCDVIEALNLTKCQNTIIGNAMMRGVSGGERKRVSIGVELLINPSLLFMDEPTSGLDSTTALKLLKTMQKLAHGGRTIVTSIHQPSSRLFLQMDKLMLFAEGRMLYNGYVRDTMDWLIDSGCPVPPGVSVPDHILDIACGDLSLSLSSSTNANDTQKRQFLEDHFTDLAKLHYNPDQNTQNMQNTQNTQNTQNMGADWPHQVRYLTLRCLKTRRFAALSTQRICEILFVAILAGLFWFQIGQDTLTAQVIGDVSGLLFFQTLFISFNALFQALLTFPPDFQILLKERQSNMYALSAYYAAKTLSDFPMDSFIPSIFCWIIYFMGGLRLQAGAFFSNWCGVLLIMFVSQSLGLLIGATIQNFRTALSITTVTVLTIMLVGGFYVRNIPIWIRWLRYLSFIFYGYGLILKIEFRNRFLPCPSDKTETCLVSQTDVLATDVDESVALQAAMLIVFLCVMRTAIFYVLKIKTSYQLRRTWYGRLLTKL